MAKRKKYTFNEECEHCVKLEKKLEETLKTLAKYKKQTNRLRHKMNELENYARENDYLSKMCETIEELESECEEVLSPEKLGEDAGDSITWTRPDGKIVTFKKPEKLSYAIAKKIERTGTS